MAATTVIAVAAIASVVATSYAAYSQGQQQRAASRANAAMARGQADVAQQQAEFNARQLELRASQTAANAAEEERRQRERARFILADQEASAAARGIELQGSPLEVLGFSATQAELDALSIRQRGQTETNDLLMGAAQQRYRGATAAWGGGQQAALDEWRGNTAARAGTYRAGGELLSGATSWWNNHGRDAFGSGASEKTPTTPSWARASTGRLAGPV